MATRVIVQQCVISPGSPPTAPQHFPVEFPSAQVDRIDVLIPPGPAGLVGFYIGHGGGSFIPDNSGTWIIADDRFIQWPLDDAPNNGNWDIVCYNNDAAQHTIWVYFNISDLAITSVPTSSGMLGL